MSDDEAPEIDVDAPIDLRGFPCVDWTARGVPSTMRVYHTGERSFAVFDGERHVDLDLTGMSFAESDRAIRYAVTLLQSAGRRKMI